MRAVRPLACLIVVGVLSAASSLAQEPPRPEAVSAADLQSAINKLGDLDYDTRTAASRLVRRTAPAQAVPALTTAVSSHADGYVRYRALVLLTGFNDSRTKDVMRSALTSPNDRLREVAYSFFELEPDPAMVSTLLTALDKEIGEFVRPSLVRALAALGADPRVQQALTREAGRGEDYFRSAVIESLGEYKAVYAFNVVNGIAKLDGPLQDDAALALGRIGDPRGLETLAGLQRTAPRATQPFVAAAICLLGVNCASHENYLVQTLGFADKTPGFQELLRSAASGLAALAVGGRESALRTLFDVGIPSTDPTRAPVALGVATVALRRTPLMLTLLEKHPNRGAAIDLMAEGFEMLEEDLSKERFFAFARRTFWASAEGSPTRTLMQALITKLSF